MLCLGLGESGWDTVVLG